jgi:hypothetical protein
MRPKVRKDPELQTFRGVPMEKQRLVCHMAEIEFDLQMLAEKVSEVPTAFVFNLDESGFQD